MLTISRVAAVVAVVGVLAALSEAQDQPKETALAAFDGMVAKVLSIQDPPQTIVAWVNMAAQRPDANTLVFEGNTIVPPNRAQNIAISLKAGVSPGSYTFSLKSSLGPSVEELPLKYSESAGFAGTGKAQTYRAEWDVAVTIKKRDAGGFTWQALFTREAIKRRFEYSFDTEAKAAGK
jgi:hypothetical protein